jgi:protein SCO1
MSAQITRRAALRQLASLPALALCSPARAQTATAEPAHRDPFGPVTPPLALPAISLVTHTGLRTDLAALTVGKVTALQLIFTRCRATCPILGSTFAAARKRVAQQAPGAQWLSISIDPGADTPAVLTKWLGQYGAGPDWVAAAPELGDLDRLLDAVRGRATGADRHTTSIYFLDRAGRLVFRSAELPSSADLADLMRKIAARPAKPKSS